MIESGSARPAPRGVAGLVLAGGRGQRMGGQGKHGQMLGGRTLLELAVERLAPQVGCLLISCNDPGVHAGPGVVAVLRDPLPGFPGPLAGILAGLEFLGAHPGSGDWLLSVAVDTPEFPEDLASRLDAGRRENDAEIAIAATRSGTHPVFALWAVALAQPLRRHLERGGDGSVRRFQARYRSIEVRWDDDRLDRNINTPEELVAAALRRPGAR